MLFVYNFPNATLMFMGIVPMPAWVLGVLIVVVNLLGDPRRDGVAYDVHLAGFGFATLYFLLGWKLELLGKPWEWWQSIQRQVRIRRLKVHSPDTLAKDDAEADRILQKIYDHGQDSLTNSEKRFLERHSRRVRQRRNS
jgi:hypothetical protein